MSSWYERSGGYLVAIFLHILLISLLATYVDLRAEVVPSPSYGGVEIDLVAEGSFAPDPTEMETQAPPTPSTPEDAARTGDEEDAAEMAEQMETMLMQVEQAIEEVKEQSEEVPVEVAKVTIPEPEPEAEPEPEPTPRPTPTPRELTAKEIEEAKLAEAYEQYNKAVQSSSQNRNSIKAAIQKEEMKVKGSQYLDEITSGADTGAVRQFTLRGSPEVVQEIMDRYRLRNVTRYVKGNGMGYLNKIDTNSGAFYSEPVEGRKEVIEYGPEVTRKLVQLEKQAMIERGFNPRTDRVLLVVFGIVQTEHGWDLGVLDMKAEKIE